MRWGVLALLIPLAGCSVAVDSTVHFHDGAKGECITQVAQPDLLDKALIVQCEEPKNVQAFVSNGTTAVQAATGLMQAGALAAFPALLGTNNASANVTVK